MNNLTYKIEFFDYWSTSSGLSGGALADNLCLKDKNNMPYLPGKTIKGLFREAADTLFDLGHEGVTTEFIHYVFGEPERGEKNENKSEKTQIAYSYFTDASFNDDTAKAIISNDLAKHLYEEIATTALEQDGLAKKHSLRRTQYALPCTLYGEILEVHTYRSALMNCAAFIKRLGLNRHRGYGRCKISFV